MNLEAQIILCPAEMNVVRQGNDFLSFPLFFPSLFFHSFFLSLLYLNSNVRLFPARVSEFAFAFSQRGSSLSGIVNCQRALFATRN